MRDDAVLNLLIVEIGDQRCFTIVVSYQINILAEQSISFIGEILV